MMVTRRQQQLREDALWAEALREVGILLVALAPLDFAFGDFALRSGLITAILVLIGILFFHAGIRMERTHG
jgi:hypothetical protein